MWPLGIFPDCVPQTLSCGRLLFMPLMLASSVAIADNSFMKHNFECLIVPEETWCYKMQQRFFDFFCMGEAEEGGRRIDKESSDLLVHSTHSCNDQYWSLSGKCPIPWAITGFSQGLHSLEAGVRSRSWVLSTSALVWHLDELTTTKLNAYWDVFMHMKVRGENNEPRGDSKIWPQIDAQHSSSYTYASVSWQHIL